MCENVGIIVVEMNKNEEEILSLLASKGFKIYDVHKENTYFYNPEYLKQSNDFFVSNSLAYERDARWKRKKILDLSLTLETSPVQSLHLVQR